MSGERKLKPCPFCGGETKIERPENWLPEEGVIVGCDLDGCAGERGPVYSNEGEAIAAWNTRAGLSEVTEALRDARKELRGAVNEMACLIPNPKKAEKEDWPCENEANRACLDNAYDLLDSVMYQIDKALAAIDAGDGHDEDAPVKALKKEKERR